jgi:cytidylate kinase
MIVTVSRQLGSQGDLIAARVATALGLLLIDREYTCRAALRAGVPAILLQKLMYEGEHSLAGQIMDSLGSSSSELAPSSVNLEDGVQAIGRLIIDLASRQNVLVLGQGGQSWLRNHRDACHVQVIAPYDLRVERVAARENISPAAARRRVRSSDQARAEYLARYHGVNWLDPLLYHYVINTGLASVDSAVALLIQAAQTSGSET